MFKWVESIVRRGGLSADKEVETGTSRGGDRYIKRWRHVIKRWRHVIKRWRQVHQEVETGTSRDGDRYIKRDCAKSKSS